MARTLQRLRFVWWNVENCAHFDASRAKGRWPPSRAASEEKLQRVGTVLRNLAQQDEVHLLALAEITKEATYDLRAAYFPDYLVHPLVDVYKGPFQVALVYRKDCAFANEDFIMPGLVPASTRPVVLLDYHASGHRVRFYACHLTANFEETSEEPRAASCRELRQSAYKFIYQERKAGEANHVVVMGDFNEEPFDKSGETLHASRDRNASRRPHHPTDAAISRVRLYNCSWRLLGEQSPHSPTSNRETAGTYYWEGKNTWHTLDQVLVSGALLTKSPPYLDEEQLRVVSEESVIPAIYLKGEHLPAKFDWNNGNPLGVSDHLPITGVIRIGD